MKASTSDWVAGFLAFALVPLAVLLRIVGEMCRALGHDTYRGEPPRPLMAAPWAAALPVRPPVLVDRR